MATSSERTQRGADPSGVSLLSGPSPEVDGGVLNTVTDDTFARSRAEALDAEAAHYARRAIQEQQALGPGYYVDLLRGMATDRAAMAQRLRTSNGATR